MKRSSTDAAFTFLEVMVALALLSMTVTLAVQLFSSNLRALASSEDRMAAMKAAECRMKEIENQDAFEVGSWTEVTDRGYRMEVRIADSPDEKTKGLSIRLLQINVKVAWKDGLQQKTWSLRTLKAIDGTMSIEKREDHGPKGGPA